MIGRWFSPGPPVTSTNKSDRHDINEILLKVALNSIKQTISSSIGLNWHWVFGVDYFTIIFYPYLNSVMGNIAIKEEDLTLLRKNVGNIYLNRDFHVVSVNTLHLHIYVIRIL